MLDVILLSVANVSLIQDLICFLVPLFLYNMHCKHQHLLPIRMLVLWGNKLIERFNSINHYGHLMLPYMIAVLQLLTKTLVEIAVCTFEIEQIAKNQIQSLKTNVAKI